MIGSRVTPNMLIADSSGRLTTEAYRLLADIVTALNNDARQVVAKADLPVNLPIGAERYVSNETGGATLAFWDGAAWRRVQDRVVVS